VAVVVVIILIGRGEVEVPPHLAEQLQRLRRRPAFLRGRP
jgi:hypothetical protein